MAPSLVGISGALRGSPSMTVGRPRSVLGGITSAIAAPVVAAANLPYQPYLPNPDNKEPFGLDISMYNWGYDFKQEPDWQMLAAYNYPKIEFIYVRGGISWGYQDPCFKRSWEALKMYTDIPRSMYHVPYVSQAVQPQVDNIEKIYDSAGGDLGEGPLIEDWELHNHQPKNKVSSVMGQIVEVATAWLSWRTDVYSGDWFVDAYAEEQEWMKNVSWLLAHYLIPTYGEHPGPPAKPNIIPRKKVAWHQSGSYFDGRVMGIPGNIRIDGNRLEAESEYPSVSAYLVKQTQPPEPPPPVPSPGINYSDLLRAEANGLRRSADQLDSIAGNISGGG